MNTKENQSTKCLFITFYKIKTQTILIQKFSKYTNLNFFLTLHYYIILSMYIFYFWDMLVFMGALQCLHEGPHNIRFSFADYSDLKHSLIHTIFVYCVLSPLFWRSEVKRICNNKYTNLYKKNNCTWRFFRFMTAGNQRSGALPQPAMTQEEWKEE